MILTDKREIRRAVRAEIAKQSTEERTTRSSLIFSNIAKSEPFQSATTIAAFVSLSDEPQTFEFLTKISQHKRVVVPRVEGEEMNFYDISEGFQKGAFGIMEPIATTPIEPNEIDLMIVPGVAFTRRGERLGRGKGFYDKYLSRKGFSAHTIGVCYHCQIVDSLPTEPHDKVMDEVIWE